MAAVATMLSWFSRSSAARAPRAVACAALSLCSRQLRIHRAVGPVALKIGVNSTCNLRCATCDIGTGADTAFARNMKAGGGNLDLGLALRAIDSVARFHPRVLIDSVEPLLYAPLFDLVRHARRRGLSCMVQTNGLLLAKRAEEMVASGLTELGLSLDGPAAVHDGIRGVAGGFDLALAGIDALARHDSRSRKAPRIVVNTVICAASQRTLVPLLEELRHAARPIAQVSLYHQNFISPSMAEAHAAVCGTRLPVAVSNMSGEDSGADPAAIDCAALADTIDEIRSRRFPFHVRFIPDISGERACLTYYRDHRRFVASRACLLPWLGARIRPDGSVGLIARCFDVSLGSIAEAPLSAIFNQTPYRNLRREMKKVGAYPACARCCGVM